jgi:hypothetical protein
MKQLSLIIVFISLVGLNCIFTGCQAPAALSLDVEAVETVFQEAQLCAAGQADPKNLETMFFALNAEEHKALAKMRDNQADFLSLLLKSKQEEATINIIKTYIERNKITQIRHLEIRSELLREAFKKGPQALRAFAAVLPNYGFSPTDTFRLAHKNNQNVFEGSFLYVLTKRMQEDFLLPSSKWDFSDLRAVALLVIKQVPTYSDELKKGPSMGMDDKNDSIVEAFLKPFNKKAIDFGMGGEFNINAGYAFLNYVFNLDSNSSDERVLSVFGSLQWAHKNANKNPKVYEYFNSIYFHHIRKAEHAHALSILRDPEGLAFIHSLANLGPHKKNSDILKDYLAKLEKHKKGQAKEQAKLTCEYIANSGKLVISNALDILALHKNKDQISFDLMKKMLEKAAQSK